MKTLLTIFWRENLTLNFLVTNSYFYRHRLFLFLATNVSILRLWSDNHKRAIYFNCLHFSFGLGNFLGPVIAETILKSDTATTPTNSTIIQSAIDPIEYDFGFLGNSFTNLQVCKIYILVFVMIKSGFQLTRIKAWLRRPFKSYLANKPKQNQQAT